MATRCPSGGPKNQRTIRYGYAEVPAPLADLAGEVRSKLLTCDQTDGKSESSGIDELDVVSSSECYRTMNFARVKKVLECVLKNLGFRGPWLGGVAELGKEK